ncbi:MAG TPA: tetratricopeptide repeat protein, partial [Kofleriaceae bacterium]|nr:tetratricopeptide repeat protein [Kofleriaceae bacterium]
LAAAPVAAAAAAAHARRSADLFVASAKRTNDDNARIKLRHQAISYVELADSHISNGEPSRLRIRAACERANRHDLAMLTALGGYAARWAAILTETAQNDAGGAVARWRPLSGDDAAATGFELDQIARLQRARIDRAGLANAYQALLKAETDPRCERVWQFGFAMVSLLRGAFQEADATLTSLLADTPVGPAHVAVSIARTGVLRAQERWVELEQLLAELTSTMTSPAARLSLQRERALVLSEALGRTADATEILEQLLAANPGDAETMVALAQLSEQGDGFERAAQLRRRAISVAPEAATKSKLLLDLAAVEQRRGDMVAAQAALERAHAIDPRDPSVLGALAQLQLKNGQSEQAVALLQTALAASDASNGADRAELQVHLARIFTAQAPTSTTTLQAWFDVLSVTPEHAEALAAIEAPATALGQWTKLAAAFRRAPRTPHNLAVLASALEKTAEWQELVDVKLLQLGHSNEPATRAELATQAAEIYADQLGDRASAAKLLVQAQSIAPDATRQSQIVDLLESAENWSDLAAALERELPTIPASDRDRQVSILRRLGELRSDKLGRYAEAAAAYESALELDSDDELTLLALEQLYQRLGRERELARIIETRAELSNSPVERGALFAKVGAFLCEKCQQFG